MAQVEALLRVLVQNQGDELRITLGEAPELLRGGAPLRFFFPVVDDALHAALLGDLLSEERRAQLADGGSVTFRHEVPGLGSFSVLVRGPGGRVARFARGAIVQEPEPTEPALEGGRERRETEVEPVATGLPEPLEALLDHAAEAGASDLHLATGEAPVLRLGGRLVPVPGEPLDVRALLGPMLGVDAARVEAGRSVDRAVVAATGTRFRVNVYRCDGGWAAAFRVLRRQAPALATLRSPVPLDGLLDFPHGLVLLCGPTGSGKSTTLAALAQEALRRRRGLLITLEDPIEYTFRAAPGSLVRQREIGRDVPDFPEGLRDALREDPDLLLIGEMRDPESIQLALTAAETGHLVLASLHSRTTSSAVERIVDAYPPERQRQIRVQLADALRAVVAQRLLPGDDGRVLALEVLRVNRAVAAMIREGKTAQIISAVQTGAQEGMLPLARCLRDLVRSGRVDLHDARAALGDPAWLPG